MKTYRDLLPEFIAFKSVSTDPQFKGEIEKTVSWLETLFSEHNFQVEIWRSSANPVVFASYNAGQKETVLVYGHYDVQPAEKEDGWKADPFTVRETNDRLFARGIIDNKGQVLIHIATVFDLLAKNRLGYNVIFLLEGDEETAGGDLDELVKKNKAKLKVDHVLVSDGEMVGETPALEVSLRGGFNATVTFKTANTNLHSGIFGSAIPNATHELASFVAGLYDSKNQCTIPGFYDDAEKVTPEQKKNNQRLLKESGDFITSAGIKKLLTEDGLDFYSQTGLRPSVQATGFKSGYISEGYANIIPAVAEVRLNFRLVPNQDPEQEMARLKKYVQSVTPSYVDSSISFHGPHFPVKVDITAPKVVQVQKHLKDSFGKPPLLKHVGGAIPVVFTFKQVLGADTMLVPLVNEDCNMHGVEENFKKDLLEKGLDFSQRFFSVK